MITSTQRGSIMLEIFKSAERKEKEKLESMGEEERFIYLASKHDAPVEAIVRCVLETEDYNTSFVKSDHVSTYTFRTVTRLIEVTVEPSGLYRVYKSHNGDCEGCLKDRELALICKTIEYVHKKRDPQAEMAAKRAALVVSFK